MYQPTKHNMRHFGGLGTNGLDDMGVVVAVNSSPPTRDPINQFSAIGQNNTRAMRSLCRKRRIGCFHLRVRQPDVR